MTVLLSSRGVNLPMQVFFDTEGQKMIFCPAVTAAPGGKVACASIYMLEDDLQAGIKRTFDVPNAVQGSAITCAYAQDHFRSLTVPK